MKERMIYYSPKNHNQDNNLDINFKKSPQKFILYDSPPPPSHIPAHDPKPQMPPPNSLQSIRKMSDEVSSLRKTMNSKYSQKMARANTLYEFQFQDKKPNKLNDFLRQTMSYRSTKPYSEKWASQLTNSNDVALHKEDLSNTYKSQKNQDAHRLTQSKSSVNLDKSNLEQYQKINQKIDRNKKIIEQLRKGPKQKDKNYLKNFNYSRSPTYLELDHEKQLDDKGFRKKKKEESAHFMTPKPSKGTYDNRFNSSPLIEQFEPQKKAPDPATTSLSNIPCIPRKTSVSIPSKSSSSPIDGFELGKKLGEGKFGCVNIARHKKTLGLFALKKIPKALIKSHMMVDQLALEIRLQSCLQHRNILGMHGFFDDKSHFYIVLEYMDGGTLYEQLKKGKFSQKQAATVIRQVTEAMENLHDMGIAHRDLKPQNIVISNDIYKLCDFGWAAMCNERRKTYCGTFDYVAPQILEGVDYDMTVDLWCLGVMTFQLMTGKAPFYHISRKQTMKRIKNVETETIQYPQSMSETARDFIDKLIRKNPSERMKASQALLHPFIKDINFSGL